MMRSLFSGVSGLKTHQTRMDVIGNNIANVNTVSYKSMSVNFSDLMYQTTQAATGPNPETGRGGTNPRQIGLGVQQASISTRITEQGASQTTGNPFDIKIAGDEFFVVSDGASNFFTRDGSFNVDSAGNLVMSSNGYTVMGWQSEIGDDGNLVIKKNTVSALKVMDEGNLTYPAEWTRAATASGIIDWNDPEQSQNAGKTMSVQFYDNLGYSYTAKFSLHNGKKPTKPGESYSYYMQLEDILDANNKTVFTDTLPKSTAKFGKAQEIPLDGEKYGVNSGTVNTKTLYAYDSATGKLSSTQVSYVNTEIGGTSTSVILYPSSLAAAPAGAGWFETEADAKASPQGTPYTIAAGAKYMFTADGTVPTDNEDLFKEIYGKSIEPGNILAATVDAKGVVSVTRKMVDGAVTLSYSGLDGKLESPLTGAILDLSDLGDAFTAIDIDFTKTLVSDNKGKSTVSMAKGNPEGGRIGRSLGSLSNIAIQTDGQIFATYTNGQRKLLGQIAVADFANAAGLQKEGDNLYSATTNSGDFDGIGIDITVNGHSMVTGVLEMSNVDLSSEFTDMITTQRGFQANSRIITVSDTLLEELINLKR